MHSDKRVGDTLSSMCCLLFSLEKLGCAGVWHKILKSPVHFFKKSAQTGKVTLTTISFVLNFIMLIFLFPILHND